ncbi:glutathione S-transferase [Nostoc sp. 3335mG]|nr:glutathione S-transferase [Nostoc sp. 3335mG]
MSDELVFYTNPMSRGRLVRWMLEEVGHPYRTEIMDYGTTMKGAAYLAINPMGKVPAITHGKQVVTECSAICAYLADAFPDAGLAPPPAERGAYYRWLFFMAGPYESAVTNKSLGVQPEPGKERMLGYGTIEQVLDAIEGALDGRDYIASDRFSAADLFVGSHLAFQMMFGNVEKRPTFTAYVDRLQARPAFSRATELDGAMPAPAAG